MVRKLALYLAAALGVLLAIRLVISAVFATLALIWSLVATTITVALLLAAGYGIYKLYGLVGTSDADVAYDRERTTRPSGRQRDPVERLRDQYANGEISERELEHRLERELTDREMDHIDRELQRERR